VALRLIYLTFSKLLGDHPSRRGRPDSAHAPLLRGPRRSTRWPASSSPCSPRADPSPRGLHEAIDVLLDGVVRARGRLWLATRPESVLWLASAGGGLELGHAGD
jgi:hypothetical protein